MTRIYRTAARIAVAAPSMRDLVVAAGVTEARVRTGAELDRRASDLLPGVARAGARRWSAATLAAW